MSGIPHKKKDTSKRVFVDTSCMTPLPSSQLLNCYGVKRDPYCLENLTRNLNNNLDYWHRFTICNESYSCSEYPKTFILKAITDFVYPCELLPLYVSQKARKTFFLARNCFDAIVKLCKTGLFVPNPDRPDSPFKVVIIKDILTVNHIPLINVEPNVLEVLKKRLCHDLLDLTKFEEDPDLAEFCPLSQPKLLLYILSLSVKLETRRIKILKILLCHNDIKHLPNLESLKDRAFNSVDLSNNKIQNIEDVVPLKDLPHLAWLQLNKNPLCCRFDSEFTYLLYLKSICKNLKTLDSKRFFEDGFYKRHKTFLCDIKGFDFANQFIEQYFTYYDELNRPNIESLYSEDVMFSLSYRAVNLYYRDHRRTREFKRRGRNLLDTMASARNEALFFYGKANVLDQLYALPVTQHHVDSFLVDLMAYSKTQAIICVTGMFRHVEGSRLTDLIYYGFTRNFVLSSKNGKEWIITNDQLYVCVPYQSTSEVAWPAPKPANLFPEPNFNPDHMDALTQTFETITGMTYEHCKNYLAKNSWNLELALHVFIDEHINDDIPEEVFNEEREEEQKEDSDDEDVIVTEEDILPPIHTLLLDKPKSLLPSISSGPKPNNNQTMALPSENLKPMQNLVKSTFLQNMVLAQENNTTEKGENSQRSRYKKEVPKSFQDQWMKNLK